MSPVSEHEVQIWRDKDGFFRNEQGLLHMAHLLALVAVIVGAATIACGLVGFFTEFDGAVNVIGIGFSSLGTGTAIEAYQTRVESRNVASRGGQ